MELLFDPVIPLLGIYPNNPQTLIRKNICTPTFIVALFTVAKMWKQSKYPSGNEWIKKMGYIYTVDYYLTMKKKEILPFVTAWMDLEIIMLSEISQSVKDRYHMILFMCGI